MNDIVESHVPFELSGQRVDVALASMFPEYSRSQLTKWLKLANISINAKTLSPKDKVWGGEKVVFIKPESFEQPLQHQAQNIPLDIIFEDDELLVINKPAGFIVHPGAGNPDNTLLNALIHHNSSLASLPRAGIVHRLDRDTTGLLVIAKTAIAQTNLARQMQEREITREYLTLVHGHVIAGDTIDTFYGRHNNNRLKMAVKSSGKKAITTYRVFKHYQTFTSLQVKLMTGRTHQIRVHMEHINHPVVGDQLYGKKVIIPKNSNDKLTSCLQQFKRQALHAARLSFVHPVSTELLTFEAPMPEDFSYLLSLLDEHVE